jgi:hypothetical protein
MMIQPEDRTPMYERTPVYDRTPVNDRTPRKGNETCGRWFGQHLFNAPLNDTT